jgi:hypothetical protein
LEIRDRGAGGGKGGREGAGVENAGGWSSGAAGDRRDEADFSAGDGREIRGTRREEGIGL